MIDKNKLKRLKADDILKVSIDKINNDINEKIEQSNKLMDNILKQLNKNKNKLSKKKITELTNKKSKVTADLKKYNLKYKNSLKLIQYLIDRNDIKSVQSIKSLIKYYANNGITNLLFDDVPNLENWGLKHIDSNDVPVVIDLGLSDEVASKYYE